MSKISDLNLGLFRKTAVLLLLIIGTTLKAQNGLDHYLEQAANNNPTLKAKYSLYLAALERVDQQGALPDPTVSFGYFISPVETRVGAQRFRVSLSQMFPWFGTRKVREQAATSLAKTRFEEFMEAKNQLFLQVRLKWLELYELQEEIDITRENRDILKTYEPVTRTKYEANLVSLADLVRVQIKIDETNAKLDLLQLKRQPLLSDFNTLLNQSPDTDVQVSNSLKNYQLAEYNFDSVLSNHPSLKAKRLELEKADTELELADLKRKPNLGIGLDYALVDRRSGVTLEDNGKDILMPMVSLSLPIFRKKNQALKNEVGFKKESIRNYLEATQNELRNRWTKAEYLIQSALRELQLYQDEIEKTNLLLRVLTTEYTNNNRDFEELLLAQQTLLTLRLSEVRARVNLQQAYFEKDYLTASTLNELK